MDSELAKARLRIIYLNKGNGTLLNALEAYLNDCHKATKAGGFLTSGSSNGTSWSKSFINGANPADELKLASWLIELYETAAATSTEDADIYAAMITSLRTVSGYHNNFTALTK